jgi:hypothetical protein
LKNLLVKVFDVTYIKLRVAEVVELGDTLRSGRSARKGMGVQIPPSALFKWAILKTIFVSCKFLINIWLGINAQKEFNLFSFRLSL